MIPHVDRPLPFRLRDALVQVVVGVLVEQRLDASLALEDHNLQDKARICTRSADKLLKDSKRSVRASSTNRPGVRSTARAASSLCRSLTVVATSPWTIAAPRGKWPERTPRRSMEAEIDSKAGGEQVLLLSVQAMLWTRMSKTPMYALLSLTWYPTRSAGPSDEHTPFSEFTDTSGLRASS